MKEMANKPVFLEYWDDVKRNKNKLHDHPIR